MYLHILANKLSLFSDNISVLYYILSILFLLELYNLH